MLKRLCLLGLLMLVVNSDCRATTYATWIMIWYGHDQAWWNVKNPDATKDLVRGEWKTLDWADDAQIGAHLDGIKKAGVTVVIADLTNGWNWLDARCQLIQKLCAERGMEFCVAENSGGNTASFESHAKDIWEKFAGPDAPHPETYFHYRGKPLIVCYSVRDWYRAYLKMAAQTELRPPAVRKMAAQTELRPPGTQFSSRFSLVWASGEDSCINKWGWQLEPWMGSIPSSDSMYVTSAVRWNPADGAMWRKSLAWMDYNFALARKSNPEYIIVGSYDDPTERNQWCVSDTAHCELGRQIRDKTGALNPHALYDRVREWTSGKVSVVPGGLLRDGAYRIIDRADGKHLGVEKETQGAPGAMIVERAPDRTPNGLFMLYHLGKNHYRIIAVHSGLALEASQGGITQNWDSTDSKQRWTISRASDGSFRVRNDATGETQQWRFEPVLIL